MWFLNVLAQSPKEQEIFGVVFHASESFEGAEGLLGLRSQVEKDEIR